MRAAVLILALALAACGPKMDGLAKGEAGKAGEVRDGDTFVLAPDLVVHLAGIEAPRGDAPHARESRAALERLVAHRSVQLAYGGEKRARDAAVAQVFAKTAGGRWVWVQEALLLSGEARVHTRANNVARLAEMRAAEAAARAGKRGLWADPAYAVRTADQMARDEATTAADPFCIAEREALDAARAAQKQRDSDEKDAARAIPATAQGGASAEPAADAPRRPRRAREFMIVDGRVANVADRERAVFLNFGDDISRDFGVMAPKDALSNWPGGLDALKALEGARVRVRGEVPRCGKPLMRVDHAAQIEALDG
jgi:endonuclease YncB( thermonuclease family)